MLRWAWMLLPALIPLFPLPDHALLIGVPASYRVFEPRYRALVDDLLGIDDHEQRWLAIPQLAEGWQSDYFGAPAIRSCAALAKARHIRPSSHGEFEIIVEGIQRCILQEQDSDRPYRLARPEPFGEEPVDDGIVATHLDDLLGHVGILLHQLGDRGRKLALLVDEDLAPGLLVDRLGAVMLGDARSRQAFLENRNLVERIDWLRKVLHDALGRGPQTPSVN